IIERDLIFNDVGNKKVNLKVDLKSDSPQSSVCKIEVQELRNFISKKKAIFEVTMEALVSDAIGYVKETDDGWLVSVNENTKENIDLPFSLKVMIDRIESNREFFTILEGSYQGVKASVEMEQEKSRFFFKCPHTDPVQLTYSVSKKIVKFKNKTYQATDHPETPWKKGIYDIEIPDYSHKGGQNYPQSKYATSWFLIGHDGERYLHLGTRSRGCMTVIEINKWDELYKSLIIARKGDGKSIGIVKVID
ncbi:MAG: hypothetical protein V1770_05320, partial [bacterium]